MCAYLHTHICVEACTVAPLSWLAHNSFAWDNCEDVCEYVELWGLEKYVLRSAGT